MLHPRATLLAFGLALEASEATVEADGRAVTARVSLPDEGDDEVELAEPMLVPEPVDSLARGAKTPRRRVHAMGSRSNDAGA